MDRTKSAYELALVGDELAPRRSVDLLEHSDFHGQLVIERFTPTDGMDAGRPLELIDQIAFVKNAMGADAHIIADAIAEMEAELDSCRSELVIVPNLITQVGDQYYGERAAGIAGAPGQVTGMKLGTGVTAPAKTGAGAALVTYKSGSQKAIDGSFPTSSLVGASRQIQWKVSWGAGVINGSALAEAVIINDVLADATSTAANTISRALFGPMTLGVSDTLSITWNHLLLGT